MNELIVVAFDNEIGACELCIALVDLQKRGLVTLDDAATVIHRADGTISVRQAGNLVGAGAWGAPFWGMLVGFLFWAPWQGLTSRERTGPGGQLVTYGLDDGFVRSVRSTVQPGRSALFMLMRAAAPDKLIGELRQFNGRILQTSLSYETEARLRDSFGVCEPEMDSAE